MSTKAELEQKIVKLEAEVSDLADIIATGDKSGSGHDDPGANARVTKTERKAANTAKYLHNDA